MNAIEIDSLSKVFKKRGGDPVQAVLDLSLSIAPGQIFGFLGPNGAGKTTTIKMMCGLVTPTSGTARLNGYDVRRERGQAMRQIGAVLEGTHNVYWRLYAWENLMYFGRLKGLPSKDLKARAEWLLTELDLWDRKDDETKEYSRGVQQKVAIAASLVADPSIVLLDEPTLGLDVQSGRTVKEWIKRLAEREDKTVLLTTHQLDMAQELCDQVAIINEGRLIADKPVDELISLFRQDYYQIRVKGAIDTPHGSLAGLQTSENGGDTMISGEIADQDHLYRVLQEVREMGLSLVSVERGDPDLEDVFVKLLEDDRNAD